MQTIFVNPAAGKHIRQPERGGEYLPATGAIVPRNQFWLRRLKDGDVIEQEVIEGGE